MSSLLDKDAGFCSGSSEHEDDHSRDGLHSPTDASEDSVEVKFTPISKNKRKSSEPLRVISDTDLGPIKKRYRYEEHAPVADIKEEPMVSSNPFRPWCPDSKNFELETKPNPADLQIRHPGVTTLHRAIQSVSLIKEQDQPLALVAKKSPVKATSSINVPQTLPNQLQKVVKVEPNYTNPIETLLKNSQFNAFSGMQVPRSMSTSSTTSSNNKQSNQRNYKNMTRERRIEANARERTRVHTISAAYDTLRSAVPAYSNTQKLSKLSVLRVACSYILTLSRLAGQDFSEDSSEPPIIDCVDAVSRTIQTEGKLRKRKDE